jgi:hypothetical protein
MELMKFLEKDQILHVQIKVVSLTSKGRSPVFGPFLKFGQAIVDAIFVQNISNFW